MNGEDGSDGEGTVTDELVPKDKALKEDEGGENDEKEDENEDDCKKLLFRLDRLRTTRATGSEYSDLR